MVTSHTRGHLTGFHTDRLSNHEASLQHDNQSCPDAIKQFYQNLMFTPKYQKLHEGMNLVQMKDKKLLKAFMVNFYMQMNVTPKMVRLLKITYSKVGYKN
jgi:hypothetical protein